MVRCAATAALLLAGLGACREVPTMPAEGSDPPPDGPVLYNPDWSEATHGRVDPRYDVVFPQDTVNRAELARGVRGVGLAEDAVEGQLSTYVADEPSAAMVSWSLNRHLPGRRWRTIS